MAAKKLLKLSDRTMAAISRYSRHWRDPANLSEIAGISKAKRAVKTLTSEIEDLKGLNKAWKKSSKSNKNVFQRSLIMGLKKSSVKKTPSFFAGESFAGGHVGKKIGRLKKLRSRVATDASEQYNKKINKVLHGDINKRGKYGVRFIRNRFGKVVPIKIKQ